MGSWGPKEIDKKTNESYGLNFPVITIRDMVKAQETLLDNLGIEKLGIELDSSGAIKVDENYQTNIPLIKV